MIVPILGLSVSTFLLGVLAGMKLIKVLGERGLLRADWPRQWADATDLRERKKS